MFSLTHLFSPVLPPLIPPPTHTHCHSDDSHVSSGAAAADQLIDWAVDETQRWFEGHLLNLLLPSRDPEQQGCDSTTLAVNTEK